MPLDTCRRGCAYSRLVEAAWEGTDLQLVTATLREVPYRDFGAAPLHSQKIAAKELEGIASKGSMDIIDSVLIVMQAGDVHAHYTGYEVSAMLMHLKLGTAMKGVNYVAKTDEKKEYRCIFDLL